jgi:hypothetical protein
LALSSVAFPLDPPPMFAGETTATDANAEQAYQFKARPVNKKVMESAGDLGVPRVVKKAPTVQREFNLSATRPTSARGKLDVGDELKTPLFSSFAKAAEPPKASPRATVSKAAAAALVKPKDFAPTKPVGFSFSSSSRQTSARKIVDVPDELTRPVFSSFGKATAPARQMSKPATASMNKKAVVERKPVQQQPAEPVESSAPPPPPPPPPEEEEEVEVAPAATPAKEEEEVAPAAADAEWEIIQEASRVPCDKRRVWAKDKMPSYMPDEACEEEADIDYVPENAEPTGLRRVWGENDLPQYLDEEADEEEDADDDDYAPTPNKSAEVKESAANVEVVTAAPGKNAAKNKKKREKEKAKKRAAAPADEEAPVELA